ncbi:N-acetylmuramoyl-L-alanine amidase [Lentilactobacillus sp. Marseille-Q4993]|uniref:peptidoglycan recognition protein family protein n=1 Tax=Lentilactobacillus sp. Marseille-Q4993 TaxID=3039492 RepID=UPI0024BD1E09|nr:N-acetylmuramoyl-L-alanine amidase [Lentilactobacillus sp. Marseille-Q4993]
MKKSFIKILATFSFATAGIFTFSTSQAAHAESVNSYIANKNIGHAKTTHSIWGGFPKNKYRHGKPEGVVVHETANPSSTLYNEIAYMKKNYNNAFVHTFIDASRIVNIANTKYLSWGAGPVANQRFIQFEQVRVHSKSAFAHEVANAAYYTASALHKYGLKPNDAAYDGKGTVWSHGAVSKFLGGTNHTDPKAYYSQSGKKWFGKSYTFADFYKLVKTTYNNLYTEKHVSYDKVTYKSADQTAELGSKYTSYRLYNHVKNSRANVTKYSWSSVKPSVGKKVYIDNVGTKSGAKTSWYRIKFSNSDSAKKYWVYGKALDNIANPDESNDDSSVTSVDISQ